MAITFDCEGCGKSYTVGDNLAGKAGTCKQCGRKMTVPQLTVSDPYGFESLAHEADESAPLPPRKTEPNRRSGGKSPLVAIVGGLGALVVLVVIGIVVSNGRGPAQVENVPEPRPKPAAPRLVFDDPAPRVPTPAARSVADKSSTKANQIKLPSFPEPGPAREIEPGVTFREVRLGPSRPGPRRPSRALRPALALLTRRRAPGEVASLHSDRGSGSDPLFRDEARRRRRPRAPALCPGWLRRDGFRRGWDAREPPEPDARSNHGSGGSVPGRPGRAGQCRDRAGICAGEGPASRPEADHGGRA